MSTVIPKLSIEEPRVSTEAEEAPLWLTEGAEAIMRVVGQAELCTDNDLSEALQLYCEQIEAQESHAQAEKQEVS